MADTTPEYQYHLKDHLGNVRLTFTSKDETDNATATNEAANAIAEQRKFLHRDKVRSINSTLFDHTYDGQPAQPNGTFAQRLSGRDNEKVGLARSLSVMPGDRVNIEVFAKYYDPSASNDAGLANLMNAIISGTNIPAGTFVDGAGYGQTTNLPFTPGWGTKDGSGAPPMAYLNWLVFDRNYVQDLGRSGYKRITTDSKETGTNVAHDRLAPDNEIVIAEAGYMYIWLSNENPTPVEVYFDDFKVTQVKSPVVQMDDYYPFGLTAQSYSRESSVPNMYKYNGKELQDELNLGWLDYGARMYDPAIARWTTIDPLSEVSRRWSPYSYCYNNPLIFVDPDGMFADYYNEKGEYLGSDGVDDKRVYQTTDAAYAANVTSMIGEDQNGPDYEALNNSSDTHDLGTTNEFGLIQLTKMGNDHIANYGSEDNYSYTDSQGNTVAAGQHGDDWVTPGVGAAFNAAVNEFVAQEGNGNITVNVNDASAFNPAKDLGHKTHFSGKSIDMPFIKSDGSSSNSISSLTQADKTKTGDFVKILSDKGFSKNYSDSGAIPNTTHVAGHKDHLHVGK
ncbi:MAG: RHS repeat-associated core domain-containing protein [Flammeovirgaceae bacterium]